jgi:hypothetical protein
MWNSDTLLLITLKIELIEMLIEDLPGEYLWLLRME